MTVKQCALAVTVVTAAGLAVWAPRRFGKTAEPAPGSKPQYVFVVSPGESPAQIHFDLKDAQVVEIEPGGTLVLHVNVQQVWRVLPHAYQTVGDTRRDVEVRFCLDEHGDVRFIPGPYDASLPLVINPIVK